MKTKRILRATVLTAMIGTSFQFFGCLGGGGDFWTRAFWTAVTYSGFEFVTDNDGVLDLFEGGNVGAAG